MDQNLVEAFFTVTGTVADSDQRVGFVVRGGQVARFDWEAHQMLDSYADLLSKRWPALPEPFTQGFDATLTTPTDNPWTLVFRGRQCLRLHPVNGTVAEVTTIASRFPGLPGAFTTGIDAALPAAGGNRVYLFRGDQCALYDMRTPALEEVKSLADTWTGLREKAPDFVNGIAAATYDPKSGKVFLFSGAHYTRADLSTRAVELDATPVDNTSWPGLVPAFTPGHVCVSTAAGDQDGAFIVDLESRTITYHNGMRSACSSPNGRYLYTTNPRYHQRECYDMATGRPVRTATASTWNPSPVIFSRDGRFAFYTEGEGGWVRIVHTGTFTPVHEGAVDKDSVQEDISRESGSAASDPLAPDPFPLALGPDGRRVYIGRDGRWGEVLEFDLDEKMQRQIFQIPDAGAMVSLAVSPDSPIAHVALTDGVVAIDLNSATILRPGMLPPCTELAFTPDGRELYCLTAGSGGGVLVVDPVDHRVRYRIPIGIGGLGTPRGIAFSHVGAYAYVADAESKSLAVIETATHRKVDSIRLDQHGSYPPRSVTYIGY
ncbi:hypothetical protein [Streptosporangium sp. NPDC000396]|uniref:hypothetical protein n=1 Tax=Streptosporangium sp. NPDC000396 TaxID=3366185 RepID=UPI0036B678D7